MNIRDLIFSAAQVTIMLTIQRYFFSRQQKLK